MNRLIKTLTIIATGLTTPVLAKGVLSNEDEILKIESGRSVYEDKIDISYLSKMIIHPKDDWIGKKVFKYNDACIEVVKELKIKKIKDPFKNLYRSANLPKKVEIGVMNTSTQVVDCSQYESVITTLE